MLLKFSFKTHLDLPKLTFTGVAWLHAPASRPEFSTFDFSPLLFPYLLFFPVIFYIFIPYFATTFQIYRTKTEQEERRKEVITPVAPKLFPVGFAVYSDVDIGKIINSLFSEIAEHSLGIFGGDP